MAALERMLATDARPTVVVTSATASMEAMRQLIRLGVADFVPQPIAREDVMGVIQAVRSRLRASPDRPTHECKILSFVHRSGGMGATSLAIQTAFELARTRRGQPKRRVCFVDLDFQGAQPGCTWTPTRCSTSPRWCVRRTALTGAAGRDDRASSRRLRPDRRAQRQHEPGGRADRRRQPSDGVVCEAYDCVVVDLPLSWTRWCTDVLAGSSRILLTLQLTVVAVKQAHLFLEQVKETSAAQTPISVVLNRYRKSWWRPGLKLREVEKALGRKVDYFVPSDYRLFSEAANHGVPIGRFHAGSGAEKQIGRLTQDALKRDAAWR